eukprot:CAMPEP_0206568928 /NCGR_PEP_ID=MMETSP0325_2-20121206/26123_1 /ASSEMBLY_ACC=CAM_ASM_000347 /TAXON_ID=2866 /ORGANISM="Crypthecodinium cohnii, Strain Seligo" /LENGTH=113 /DNA_ID=CAMNT_0054072397 /DNA_START=132 /DNA_END=473 /DNA_ORIENTATION=-
MHAEKRSLAERYHTRTHVAGDRSTLTNHKLELRSKLHNKMLRPPIPRRSDTIKTVLRLPVPGSNGGMEEGRDEDYTSGCDEGGERDTMKIILHPMTSQTMVDSSSDDPPDHGQ